MKRTLLLGVLAVALTCFGCHLGQSGVEEGATTGTADGEIPGTRSPNDLDPITAELWIDDVRVGRGLDINGQVPIADVTDTFSEKATIHVSMEVTDAPAGSMVMMTVSDPAGVRLWSEEKPVSPGLSHLSFSLSGSELGPGDYRAELIVGDELVKSRSFLVKDDTVGKENPS